MDHRENQSPAVGSESDLSKAQNQQQPFEQKDEFAQDKQPPEDQSRQQPPEGQADYGSAGQSDTASQQRSEIEGGTSTGQASDGEGGFLGAQGAGDTSSELIEDDDDFAKDGQGASE